MATVASRPPKLRVTLFVSRLTVRTPRSRMNRVLSAPTVSVLASIVMVLLACALGVSEIRMRLLWLLVP